MKTVALIAAALIVQTACYRPTTDYEVRVYGQGTMLGDILPSPEPYGGQVELARYRLWGTNLGLGVTNFGGDQPRADGKSVVVGYASFGWPADPGYDRNSSFVHPGPPAAPGEDLCFTRVDAQGYLGISESVDVGDHVAFTGANGDLLRLERDPPVHPRPAGESWYVGYGGTALPVVRDHALLPDTWWSDADVTVSFPGTIAPPEATFGTLPYPGAGQVRFPEEIAGLRVNGVDVRAPTHGYVDGVWVGDDHEDDVRFAGPWHEGTGIEWTPSASGEPVTITVKYLAAGVEAPCSAGCDDCGPGFYCEEGACVAAEGSSWNLLGELVCTVDDDGEFTLTADHLATLELYYPLVDIPDEERWAAGALLMVSRMGEDVLEVPDVHTANGKRVDVGGVRTRVTDTVVTRLELP